ncbi:MAG TPA: endoribonuclease MazF [Ignavibacteria bacterium]|jgi:mRNA interferase MazF
MPIKYIPERGDVVWLDLDPQAGHEQRGRRPALVISPKAYNEKVGLGLFCPITNQIKEYPFEVKIPSDYKVNGVVLSDQIKNLDWEIRNIKFICNLSDKLINEVIRKIQVLL